MNNIYNFKDILNSPDRTFGSMLEVKVGAANKVDYFNRMNNHEIILNLKNICKAYPNQGINLETILEEAYKPFEFNENMTKDNFEDALKVIDTAHNIKFIACSIVGKIIDHIEWEEALEICYTLYISDINKFNRCIKSLIILSSQKDAVKYRRITYTKFVLDIPLSGEMQNEIEMEILHFAKYFE